VPRDMTLPDGWTWDGSIRYAAKVIRAQARYKPDWHEAKGLANHATYKAWRSFAGAGGSAWKSYLWRAAAQLGRLHSKRAPWVALSVRGCHGITPMNAPARQSLAHAYDHDRCTYEPDHGAGLAFAEMWAIIPEGAREVLAHVIDGASVRQAAKLAGHGSRQTTYKRLAEAREALIAAGYEPPRCVAGEPARPKRDRSRVAQGVDRAAGEHTREAAA
jgi:hypothetical protein